MSRLRASRPGRSCTRLARDGEAPYAVPVVAGIEVNAELTPEGAVINQGDEVEQPVELVEEDGRWKLAQVDDRGVAYGKQGVPACKRLRIARERLVLADLGSPRTRANVRTLAAAVSRTRARYAQLDPGPADARDHLAMLREADAVVRGLRRLEKLLGQGRRDRAVQVARETEGHLAALEEIEDFAFWGCDEGLLDRSKFAGRAELICRETAAASGPRLRREEALGTLERKLSRGVSAYRRGVRRLERLEPPVQLRPRFREAVRAVRGKVVVLAELEAGLRARKLSPAAVQSARKRLARLSRRSALAWRTLEAPLCARL